MARRIASAALPTMRPFGWRALVILVLLQFAGNLAALPLLRATGMPAQPNEVWLFWTALSVIIIGIGLFLGARIGLGAPLLEGQLKRGKRAPWARRVIAISLLFAVGASVLVLVSNIGRQSGDYPASWQIFLAAIDAGVQEEIFSRLFLVTLFAWLGSLISRDEEGRPSTAVMWGAIVLSGLIFAWGHIDEEVFDSAFSAPFLEYTLVVIVGAVLGIILGWLYWKQGIECAILAHFLVDAIAAGIVVPAFLSRNAVLIAAVTAGLGLVTVTCWRVLTRPGVTPASNTTGDNR